MSYPHFSSDCGIYHGLVVDFDGSAPEIVTLCGSTRFREEFHRINRELTKQGVIVLAPGVFGHFGDVVTEHDKERLDVLHFDKIRMAHRVVIVNPGGYIGESTTREIAYARKHGKPIEYLEEMSAEVTV